ncbi:luciferin sulfotransferase-like [Diachasmimorpha longicaudata]|uniref:luciferin sulfotransferase-like n=1 Tax=Diachasmimorpha longicaudata TaxID=58733 RepID=UPI0030B87ACF
MEYLLFYLNRQVQPRRIWWSPTKEAQDLDALLDKTFTTEFRTGYTNVAGMTVPNTFPPVAERIDRMTVYDDDVWLGGFPTADSTLVQEMVWYLGNNLDDIGAVMELEVRFPLLEASGLLDKSALIEAYPEVKHHLFAQDSIEYVKSIPRPRYIQSNLPLHLLPWSWQSGQTNAKMIYVYKEPEDVCMSFFKYAKHIAFRGTFEQFATLFLNDRVPFAPFWSHVISFWNKRNDLSYNILFLRYKEIEDDLASVVTKVRAFLNKPPLSKPEMELVLDHLSPQNMENNPAVNHRYLFEFAKEYLNIPEEEEVVGEDEEDQQEAKMTPELQAKFDDWVFKKIRGTDFYLGRDVQN